MARHRRAHDAQSDESQCCHVDLRFVVNVWLGLQPGQPAQPSGRGGLGFVFAADVAGVADAVEMLEQEGVVDLASARLVTPGVVGQLDVGDARQVLLHRRGQLAFHALHVIDVVLQEQVVAAHLVHKGQRLRRAVQVKAGNVEGVDRLDQQTDAVGAKLPGGVTQVADQGGAQHGGVGACRGLARQTVDLGDAQRSGVFDGAGHALAEFIHPVGQAGDAALARIPVARGQVVQHDLHTGLQRGVAHLLRGVGVGKEEFHRLETGFGGSFKTVDERLFGEEHGEVGGKLRHVGVLRLQRVAGR